MDFYNSSKVGITHLFATLAAQFAAIKLMLEPHVIVDVRLVDRSVIASLEGTLEHVRRHEVMLLQHMTSAMLNPIVDRILVGGDEMK